MRSNRVMLALLLSSILISATCAQAVLDQPLLEQQADQTADPPQPAAAAAADPAVVPVEAAAAEPAAVGASDIVTPSIIAGPLAYDPARQGQSPGGFYRWAVSITSADLATETLHLNSRRGMQVQLSLSGF
jgi:hypothetical protein